MQNQIILQNDLLALNLVAVDNLFIPKVKIIISLFAHFVMLIRLTQTLTGILKNIYQENDIRFRYFNLITAHVGVGPLYFNM